MSPYDELAELVEAETPRWVYGRAVCRTCGHGADGRVFSVHALPYRDETSLEFDDAMVTGMECGRCGCWTVDEVERLSGTEEAQPA